MFKRVGLFFCGLSMVAALTSCGEEDLGGGIGEFTTVRASATALTNRLEADLITGNTCSTAGSTGGTFLTESVDVEFTSTELFSTGALDLVISSITVQYTPVNPATTPDLPDYFIATTETVGPGDAVTIPVAVMTDSYKQDLFLRPTQNLTACSGVIYKYYVDVIFEVSEPGGNGKTRNVSTRLNVEIADRTT